MRSRRLSLATFCWARRSWSLYVDSVCLVASTKPLRDCSSASLMEVKRARFCSTMTMVCARSFTSVSMADTC